jgi:hypothetical protein
MRFQIRRTHARRIGIDPLSTLLSELVDLG